MSLASGVPGDGAGRAPQKAYLGHICCFFVLLTGATGCKRSHEEIGWRDSIAVGCAERRDAVDGVSNIPIFQMARHHTIENGF